MLEADAGEERGSVRSFSLVYERQYNRRRAAGETARGWAETRAPSSMALESRRKRTMTNRRVSVFGPAYLDRVLRVDQPLLDPALGPPLDQSVEGAWKFGANPIARAGRSRRIHDRSRAAGRLAGPDGLDPPGTTDPPGRHRTAVGARTRLAGRPRRNGSRLRRRARGPAL